jgi:hypothetical protein
MVVTATGDRTFVGRAAALVNKASGGTGHFTEVLFNHSILIIGPQRYWNYSFGSRYFNTLVCLYCVRSYSSLF